MFAIVYALSIRAIFSPLWSFSQPLL